MHCAPHVARLTAILLILTGCGSDSPTAPTVVGYSVVAKTSPPATAVVGSTVAVAFTVTESRSDGSASPASGKSVTLAVTAGSGTVNGSASATVTSAADGAVSANWLLGTTAGVQSLRASVSAAQFAEVSVTTSPPPATQLALTTLPSVTTQSGVRFVQQPTVQLRDASGNAVLQAQIPITVAIDAGGGLLAGDALTVNTNASGAAVFSGLTITGVTGLRTLKFTATLNGAAVSVTAPMSVSAGAASQLAFTTPLSGTVQNGVALATPPSVQLQDAAGNSVAQALVPVTVAISAGGGTLSGPTTVNTNTSGAAVFNGLSMSGLVGSRTLTFTASLGGTVVSVPATLALTVGAGSQLGVATAPSATAQNGVVIAQQPVIQVRDIGGNPVALAQVPVTVTLDGAGTLGGTTTVNTNASGAAIFAGLVINGPVGNRTLRFSATLAGAATSINAAPIVLAAGAATQLLITSLPAASTAVGFALVPSPTVQVSDAFGNAVTQAGVAITVSQPAAAALPTAATALVGTTTVITDASGRSTFDNLKFIGNTGATALAFSASVGGQTRSIASGSITVSRPANGKIVFKRGRDELWVINPDGSGLSRLTPGYGNATCQRGDEFPAWSPDGSKIAFTRTRDDLLEVWVMDADGSSQTRLTFGASVGSGCTDGVQKTYAELPAWSPDGSKILFTRDASTTSDDQDTWIMNADGSDQVKLFGSPGVREGQATFSTDGVTIAFRRIVLNPSGCSSGTDGSEVWLVNANGSSPRRLTTVDSCSLDTYPDWSPDGQQIYVSVRASNLSCGAEIVRVSSDPTNTTRTQLTNCVDGEGSKHARVSPDGTRIVFQNNGGANPTLWLMRADGTQQTLLTTGTFDSIDDPHWQPVQPALAGVRRPAR